ncbi:MAG: extracellular solute-binding protein [Phycisphaerae bacterium]
MNARKFAVILVALGAATMVTQWGNISEWVEASVRQEEQRPRKVVYWTSSGSPEVDLKRARQFEQIHKDIDVQPNFRETGGLQDILFVSFLSGNPPDYMSVKTNELRKFVLIGGLYPLDGLLKKENEQLAEKGMTYFDQYLIGKARVHRFFVNPDDQYLRNFRENPLQAARLLNMHGSVIGLRDVSMPSTVTYNKRLFREAHRMFPDAGLVVDGEVVPPKTWLDFYRKAKIITEYGKRAAKQQGLPEPVCYGAVLQGQRDRDLDRGVKPLARRAGSMAFAFEGDTNTVHQYLSPETREEYQNKRIAYFDYDSPQQLAAFALLLKLKQDDLILPGTEARHYEDTRTALASGKAAMLIDGWHAALIGAERVPWAAQDLGSAPIPLPYHRVDPNSGWTEQRVQDEKRRIHTLLRLDELGIELPPGNRLPRTAEDNIQFFSSLCRDPEATWEWIHFTDRNVKVMRDEARRGTVPQTREALKHLGDSDWFPYPYQMQVYNIIDEHCAMWPERPLHGPVQPDTKMKVFWKWFYQTDVKDMGEILVKARTEVQEFTEAANRDLAKRIEDGIVRPEEWTFPDWDPKDAEKFFARQQQGGSSPEAERRLDKIRADLAAYLKENPQQDILNENGRVRNDIWRWRTPGSMLQLLWVPLLIGGVTAGWFVWTVLRNRHTSEDLLAKARRGAKSNWHGYVFVLPGILAIFVFAIYPSIYQFGLATYSGDGLGVMRYVGWENFNNILNPASEQFDSDFWMKVIPNTLMYMVIVCAGQVCLGLVIASLLNLPLKSNRFYRVLFFIPLVTSLAVVSVILIGLLRGENSGLNQFLIRIGLEDLPYWVGLVDDPGKMIDWLGQKTGLYTVMVVGIWHGLPFNIILLLAGLQSIPPQLYEAAKVDGANAWRRFIHVTIPEMAPILIVIGFNAFIGAAKAFSSVFVLTEGGADHSSELVATYIFKKGFMKPEGTEPNLGYAAALGVVYSLMLMGLTITNVVIIARRWTRKLKMQQQAGTPVKEGADNV